MQGAEELLYWSDVAERLGADTSVLKRIQQRFASALGLSDPKRVPPDLLPTISVIVGMIYRGARDEEILAVLSGKSEHGWPDEVLERITENPPDASACIEETLSAESEVAAFTKLGENIADLPGSSSGIANLFLDIRRDVSYHAVGEREQIERLIAQVHRLTQEVRELRYALLLSESRKSRKKGKGIARLLKV